MVKSVKHDFRDMPLDKEGNYYEKIDVCTSSKINQNEDCVLELTTTEGANLRFLLNEIVGRYTCFLFHFK